MANLTLVESYNAQYTRNSDGGQAGSPIADSRSDGGTFDDIIADELTGPVIPADVTIDLSLMPSSTAQYLYISSASLFNLAFNGLSSGAITGLTRILVGGNVTAANASIGIIITPTIPSQVFKVRLLG